MPSRQATSEYARTAGRAVGRVQAAIKAGRLVRQPCVDCGATEKVQAHHHNGYDREHELDVVWLCRPHHMQRHGKRGSVPSWDRSGKRWAYMEQTRGDLAPADRWRYSSFSPASSPKHLFRTLERVWSALKTDEERAYALALVERLAKGEATDEGTMS